MLQFLLAGLQEPRLSSVSAQALQSIASTCRDHMKSHFHGLIQIAEAMDTFNLSSEAAIGLLKGKTCAVYMTYCGKIGKNNNTVPFRALDIRCFLNQKVLIFFFFLHKNIFCEYSLEVPH